MREADTGIHAAVKVPYDVVPTEFLGGEHNGLVRRDLQNIRGNVALVMRGLARTPEDLEQADHPRGVVYLDGACRGPYMDASRRIYSLDHHEGCIRPITLATCVQALRFTRARVIAAVGYKIVSNDPDLDTILGNWALMHADKIAYDDAVFRKVRPVFDVAGNTDAYGFGHDEFLNLSAERVAEIRGRILWFTERERRLKDTGRWNSADFLDHLEKVLLKIDEYAFYPGGAEEVTTIEAHETVTLPNGDTVIFAQASMGGVYGAERELIHKAKADKCVAIVFHDGKTKWTIKLTQLISRYNLDPLWPKLTLAETNSKVRENVTDRRLLRVGWGGSAGIGGEPRYHNGRGPFLHGEDIKRIVEKELIRQQRGFAVTPGPVPEPGPMHRP